MLPPLQILLVEDNPINQKVATAMLVKAGHAVTLADNGRKAVDCVAERRFDLILMDIQMPEMDGLQATVTIRQRECGTDQHVPIVALTANALDGDREKCIEAGMDGYVTKPVKPGVLFQAMADALGIRGQSV